MGIPLFHPSLTGGELSPALFGRVDLARYQQSLKKCSNFVVQAHGGIKNRQGTRYIANAKTANQVRLVPFTFNADQSYVIELGHLYYRVFSQGAQVMAADNVTPVEVTTPWMLADLRDLKFSQSADVMTVTHSGYPPYQITRSSDGAGVVSWGLRNMTLDLLKLGPFSAINTEDGKVISVNEIEVGRAVTVTSSLPMFSLANEGQLFYIEQRNFGTPWESSKTVAVGSIRRSDGKYYMAETAGTTGTLRPSHDRDTWSDGDPGVRWRYLHPGFGVVKLTTYVPADEGRTMRGLIMSRIPDEVLGAIDASSKTTFASVERVVDGTDPSGSLDTVRVMAATMGIVVGDTVDVQFIYDRSLGGSTVRDVRVAVAAVASDSVSLELNYLSMDFANPADVSGTIQKVDVTKSGPTYKWAFGAWGPRPAGYPTCSAYFQQRHWFGGSLGEPQAVWASRTADYTNFSKSSPIQDDDSLSFELASAQIDGVEAMVAFDRLVMFTAGGNWVTESGQSSVITPGNISAKIQNYYGIGSLPPLTVGNTALYYGRSGTVRDMAYDFSADSYVGNDITIMASHLFDDRRIVEWAAQIAPFPIVWCVMDDGALLGATYLKEQNVIGWHRHDLTGTVGSVCVVNECGEDHVYLAVKRGSVWNIEYMTPRVDDLLEAFFVDSGYTFDFRNTNAASTITVTGGTTWTSADTLTVTCTDGIFTSGSGDEGDQIVLLGADGVYYRLTLKVGGYTSPTVRTATLASGTLPADLRSAATSSWAFARDTFGGMTSLDGKTVAVYSDGAAKAQRACSGGVVSLAGEPGFVVHIGLPMANPEIETLNVVVPGEKGPLLENSKLITTVRLMLEKSRSCWIGPDTSHLDEAFLTDASDVYTPVSESTGIIEQRIPASWNRNGGLVVQHRDPTPLTILAIIPDATVGAA